MTTANKAITGGNVPLNPDGTVSSPFQLGPWRGDYEPSYKLEFFRGGDPRQRIRSFDYSSATSIQTSKTLQDISGTFSITLKDARARDEVHEMDVVKIWMKGHNYGFAEVLRGLVDEVDQNSQADPYSASENVVITGRCMGKYLQVNSLFLPVWDVRSLLPTALTFGVGSVMNVAGTGLGVMPGTKGLDTPKQIFDFIIARFVHGSTIDGKPPLVGESGIPPSRNWINTGKRFDIVKAKDNTPWLVPFIQFNEDTVDVALQSLEILGFTEAWVDEIGNVVYRHPQWDAPVAYKLHTNGLQTSNLARSDVGLYTYVEVVPTGNPALGSSIAQALMAGRAPIPSSYITAGAGGPSSGSGAGTGKVWAVKVSDEGGGYSTEGWTELSSNGNGAAAAGHTQSPDCTGASVGACDFATLGQAYPNGTHLIISNPHTGASSTWPKVDSGNGSSFGPAIGLTSGSGGPLPSLGLSSGDTAHIQLADGGSLSVVSGFGSVVSATVAPSHRTLGAPAGLTLAKTASQGGNPFSNNQLTFAAEFIGQSGFDGAVVMGWMAAEEPPGANSTVGNNNQDWLNVGGPGAASGAQSGLWSDSSKAADNTWGWITGSLSVPGFGSASHSIQAALGNAAGLSASALIDAINGSGWLPGGYSDLPGLVSQYGKYAPNATGGGGNKPTFTSGGGGSSSNGQYSGPWAGSFASPEFIIDTDSEGHVTPKGAKNHWYKLQRGYGLRPLQISSPLLFTPQDAQEQAEGLLQFMSRFVKSGTLTIPGEPVLRIGNNIQVYGTLRGRTVNRTYYIEGVAHNYTDGQGYTTTLQLTHGRDPWDPKWGDMVLAQFDPSQLAKLTGGGGTLSPPGGGGSGGRTVKGVTNPAPGATGGRLDAGCDGNYSSKGAVAMYSGTCHVTSHGWPGDGDWIYIINDDQSGPDWMKVVYYAEGAKATVSDGTHVTVGQKIGDPVAVGGNGSPGNFEIGPATAANNYDPLAHIYGAGTQGAYQVVTAFYNLIHSLGFPAQDGSNRAGNYP